MHVLRWVYVCAWVAILRFHPGGQCAEQWISHHGLLDPPSCVIHGREMMRDVPGRSDIQVCRFHEFSTNPCRLKRGKYEPYVSSRMKLDAGKLLRVWADIADNLAAGQTVRNRCIHRKVMTRLLQDLGNAALHQDENTVYTFSRLQMDETLPGKRKYQRGRLTRKTYVVSECPRSHFTV